MSVVLPHPLVIKTSTDENNGQVESLDPWGVQDDLEALAEAEPEGCPAARVPVLFAQSVGSGATVQLKLGTTAWEGPAGVRVGNQLVLPVDGMYVVTAWVRWENIASAAEVYLQINHNGFLQTQANATHQGFGACVNSETVVRAVAGDTVDCTVYQADASARTIVDGVLSMTYVGRSV